jgi:hypothetical protein
MKKQNRRIGYSVTFDVVTPESAEQGNFAETGFEVEDRALLWSCEETAIDAAVELIADRLGHVEASSYPNVDASTWFTSADPDVDFTDGSERRESVHFTGFSDAEMTAVANALKAKGLL